MSRLREKLQMLRGSRAVDTSVARSPTVGERVARLRGSSQGKPFADVAEQLAAQTGGVVIAPHLVKIERRLSGAARHGRGELQQICAAFNSRLLPRPVDRLVFLDTETTGLAGGTGTVAFLVGWIDATADGITLCQYVITAFAAESAMLTFVSRALGGTPALVTYNGKSFDQPLLATRFRLHGVAHSMDGWCHVDLVHPARRAFASRWPDCRLQTCESRLLAVRRHNDIPGHEIPLVWFELLRSGSTTQMEQVIDHNRSDLLSLAMLLPGLNEVYYNPASFAADVAAVARYWHERDEPARAIDLLSRQQNLTGAEQLDLARWYRQSGNWTAAVNLWETGAVRQCCESLLNLAKYWEHQRRDYTTALRYAERLLRNDTTDDEHQLRYQRLLRKIGLLSANEVKS